MDLSVRKENKNLQGKCTKPKALQVGKRCTDLVRHIRWLPVTSLVTKGVHNLRVELHRYEIKRRQFP